MKSTQRHKWRGLILKGYFEKRGQARLDGDFDECWCIFEKDRDALLSQQRAFWAIWWLWVWHMDRVHVSSPLQIHYMDISDKFSTSIFSFFSSHFQLFCFGHCKPAITFSILFLTWSNGVKTLSLLAVCHSVSIVLSVSLSLSCCVLLCCTGQAAAAELIRAPDLGRWSDS